MPYPPKIPRADMITRYCNNPCPCLMTPNGIAYAAANGRAEGVAS